MVAAHLLIINDRVNDFDPGVILTDQEVVKTPAFVARPEIRSHRPKCELHLHRIQVAEGVIEALSQKFCERLALLWCVTRSLFLALRVVNIYFGVGYI